MKMKVYPGRTTLAGNIVTEYIAPLRASRKPKILIFCSGLPGYPGNTDFMISWAKQGYWVFVPRYRGSWESDGKLLKQEPTQDILDCISSLSQPFTDAWTNKSVSCPTGQIVIMGSSFGGPAAIFASQDPRVSKAIAICPVIDWTRDDTDEPILQMANFVQHGFGQAYRVDPRGWAKLQSGKFYNPQAQASNLSGDKLLLIHAKDDNIAPYAPTASFAKTTGAKLLTLNRGGHLGRSCLELPRVQSTIKQFLHKL